MTNQPRLLNRQLLPLRVNRHNRYLGTLVLRKITPVHAEMEETVPGPFDGGSPITYIPLQELYLRAFRSFLQPTEQEQGG